MKAQREEAQRNRRKLRNPLIALLCIVLIGALVISPTLGFAEPEEGGEGTTTAIEAAETEMGETADLSLADSDTPEAASALTLFGVGDTVTVHLDGEEAATLPGTTDTYQDRCVLQLRLSYQSEDLDDTSVIARLTIGTALPIDIRFGDFASPVNGICHFSKELTESSVLVIDDSFLGFGTWYINITHAPILPSNAIPLVYGETRSLSDFFNPNNSSVGYLLMIPDGISDNRQPDPGTVEIRNGYTINGSPYINWSEYFSYNPTTRQVTAIKPTDGLYAVSPTGESYPISVLICQGGSPTRRVEVAVYKARLYLSGSVNFTYGQDIPFFANQAIFYANHVVVKHADNGPDKPLSNMSWSLNEAFNNPPVDIITYAGGLDEYPDLNAGALLSWKPALSYDTSRFAIVGTSIQCSFNLRANPSATQLIRGLDGEELIEDAYTHTLWSCAPELKYSPEFGYESFELGRSLDAHGSIINPLGPTFPTASVSGIVATNSGDVTILKPDHYAVILGGVKYDGEAPLLESIEFLTPETNLAGIKGYTDTTTVTLNIVDLPTALSPEVSGINSIDLQYIGPASGFSFSGWDPARVDGVPAPDSASVSFDLAPSDQRYELQHFLLTVTDVAGNICEMYLSEFFADHPGDWTEAIIVDADDPIVSVEFWSSDEQYAPYFTERTVSITITEAHFSAIIDTDLSRSIVTITSGSSQTTIKAIDFQNFSNDGLNWEWSTYFDQDGNYDLKVDFVDFVNREARGDLDTYYFVIDNTPPDLWVTFNNNDFHSPFYYNAPRIATISVTDQNFDPSSLGSVELAITAVDGAGTAQAQPTINSWSGQPHGTYEASINFDQELHYTFTLRVTDLAGNSSEIVTEEEFVIDMTSPTITIENVSNTQAIAGAVIPRISFFDLNLEAFDARVEITRASGDSAWQFRADEELTDTTKVLAYSDLDEVLENDDVYILTAHIIDKAGNEAQETIIFSVNRFGSNYVFSSETAAMAGTYLSKPQEIVVNEINVSGLQSQETVVRVSAGSGVSTLDPDDDYSVQVSTDKSLWSHNIYTIPASYFTEDGFYRVMFRSVDLAGNLSENTMDFKNAARDNTAELAFAIDTTDPIGSILNIQDNGIYNVASVEAQMRVSDNIALASARLLIDGVEVISFVADDIQTNYTETFVIPEADHAQNITLEIKDRAGNTTVITKSDIMVSSNLLTLLIDTPLANWFASTPLFGILLGLLIAALAAAFWFLFLVPFKRRKKEEKEEAELTFKNAEQT